MNAVIVDFRNCIKAFLYTFSTDLSTLERFKYLHIVHCTMYIQHSRRVQPKTFTCHTNHEWEDGKFKAYDTFLF